MHKLKFKIWSNKLSKFISDKTFVDSEGSVYVFHQSVGFTCGHDDKGEFVRLGSLTEKRDCMAVYYTGIKDKHGREIYEGDIVSFQYFSGEDAPETTIEEVYFSDGMFLFGRKIELAMNDLNFRNETLAVLGNIYENPELLTNHD